MAMKKKAASRSGASDKAKKAESARMTKAAAARKASGQTYIDKRGTGLGFKRGDTAGWLATTPQSSKFLPMAESKGKNPVKYGGYGKTGRRQLDQDKRKDAKKAAKPIKAQSARMTAQAKASKKKK